MPNFKLITEHFNHFNFLLANIDFFFPIKTLIEIHSVRTNSSFKYHAWPVREAIAFFLA